MYIRKCVHIAGKKPDPLPVQKQIHPFPELRMAAFENNRRGPLIQEPVCCLLHRCRIGDPETRQLLSLRNIRRHHRRPRNKLLGKCCGTGTVRQPVLAGRNQNRIDHQRHRIRQSFGNSRNSFRIAKHSRLVTGDRKILLKGCDLLLHKHRINLRNRPHMVCILRGKSRSNRHAPHPAGGHRLEIDL